MTKENETKKQYLTEEQKKLAIDMAAEGKSITQIVDALCVSNYAFMKMRQHDPLFEQSFEHARHEGLEHIADNLLVVADEYTDVQRARLKSDNAKWLLSKRKPKIYGDKIDVNINQTIDISGALSEAKQRALPIRDVTPKEKDNDNE